MGIIIDDIRQDHIRPGTFTEYDAHDNALSEMAVKEPSELGDSLRELNNDQIEKGTRMSGIDLRSKLHYIEVSSILAVDSLVSFRMLPLSCISFTRSKKRLAVSVNGSGRQDIVNIVSGQREQDAKTSGGMNIAERFKSFFTGTKNDKQV